MVLFTAGIYLSFIFNVRTHGKRSWKELMLFGVKLTLVNSIVSRALVLTITGISLSEGKYSKIVVFIGIGLLISLVLAFIYQDKSRKDLESKVSSFGEETPLDE